MDAHQITKWAISGFVRQKKPPCLVPSQPVAHGSSDHILLVVRESASADYSDCFGPVISVCPAVHGLDRFVDLTVFCCVVGICFFVLVLEHVLADWPIRDQCNI